jgi:hypothetical protein
MAAPKSFNKTLQIMDSFLYSDYRKPTYDNAEILSMIPGRNLSLPKALLPGKFPRRFAATG